MVINLTILINVSNSLGIYVDIYYLNKCCSKITNIIKKHRPHFLTIKIATSPLARVPPRRAADGSSAYVSSLTLSPYRLIALSPYRPG
ncbi:hypothetical protein EDWATA_02944 [Edwardsiella tarda ATCC 23685]|uniref:Uncharacterized protein n=1 Tax=Edwardsiella tarda ATCC 23685 TaxID=500638 RepID=D4F857_EDWTA|nr:hypothetical protein EDWATA_02944 [Edwardsiella tarda ATCC 23685]